MTVTAIISITILALVIVLATVGPVSLGALGFVAAFVVGGLMAGESTKEVLGDFPADLFLMLVGVTYLFGIARSNQTIDWAVDSTFRMVRGRASALPWVFFGLSTVLCAVGGNPAAVAVILLPVGMTIASAHGVRVLVVAITIGMGSTAGTFSPLGILGITIRGVQESNGLAFDPGLLFGATLVAGVVAAGAATALNRSGRPAGVSPEPVPVRPVAAGASVDTTPGPAPRAVLDTERAVTLASFVVLVVGTLLFAVDIGFLALTLAVVLTMAYPGSGRAAVREIGWGVVLLLTGIVTFIGVLERNGTIAWAGEAVASIQPALLAALLICVIGAVTSAFASTLGMMTALVPMTVPLVLTGDVSAVGVVIALGISASLVDVSPFSTCGALAMANAAEHERRSIYRGLLAFAASVAVLGPLGSWGVLVATGWF
ncbi:MAG: anion permease [Pseudonocardia sp.]|nr:anion permease [Pseudonocardia sp.]